MDDKKLDRKKLFQLTVGSILLSGLGTGALYACSPESWAGGDSSCVWQVSLRSDCSIECTDYPKGCAC